MRIFQLIFIIIVFIISGVSAVAFTGVVSDLVREGNASSDDLFLAIVPTGQVRGLKKTTKNIIMFKSK